jgi:DNA-binding transcriptional LysR family regulator
MNNLSNMQLFLRVVQEGSFSAAARALGVTPSSISRQVSQLETELDARLFQRTTRKQSLTEAGNIYFQHAERIVADIDNARLAVHRHTNAPSGSLHVTVEADFALAHIEPLLPEFLARYPDVQIRLSMGVSLVDLVDSGIDVAIRFGHLNDSNLIARKIAVSHSIVCASPEYLSQAGTPKHPHDLINHSCLSFQTKNIKNSWRFNAPNGEIDVPISGRLNANSVVFLRNSAVNGLGITMIPSWIIQDELEQRHLVPILDDFSLVPNSTPIHAIFSHRRHLAPKVRVFVDFLAEKIGEFL